MEDFLMELLSYLTIQEYNTMSLVSTSIRGLFEKHVKLQCALIMGFTWRDSQVEANFCVGFCTNEIESEITTICAQIYSLQEIRVIHRTLKDGVHLPINYGSLYLGCDMLEWIYTFGVTRDFYVTNGTNKVSFRTGPTSRLATLTQREEVKYVTYGDEEQDCTVCGINLPNLYMYNGDHICTYQCLQTYLFSS